LQEEEAALALEVKLDLIELDKKAWGLVRGFLKMFASIVAAMPPCHRSCSSSCDNCCALDLF
jgi:hypothetical protein